jgi:TetR/AcrR family transcriptional regulator, fatty acid metabolism regulator protein
MARPRTDIEPRIVSAAAVRFAESGVEAASLRSIAKDAGTSIGMVYYYFPTKDDLFFAVVEEVYAALLDDLTRAIQTPGNFEERVRALYGRIGALKPNEKPILRLVALEAISGSPRFSRLIDRFKRGHIALMFQLVAEGVQSGTFRQDVEPFAVVASMVAIGTMPQVFLQVGGPHLPVVPKVPNETIIAQLVEVLFRGIGRRANDDSSP